MIGKCVLLLMVIEKILPTNIVQWHDYSTYCLQAILSAKRASLYRVLRRFCQLFEFSSSPLFHRFAKFLKPVCRWAPKIIYRFSVWPFTLVMKRDLYKLLSKYMYKYAHQYNWSEFNILCTLIRLQYQKEMVKIITLS